MAESTSLKPHGIATEGISKLATRAERLAALSQTGLVRQASDGDTSAGVIIWDGTVHEFGFRHSVRPFPYALLQVTKEPSKSEIEEVFLGQNRILFVRNKDLALEWLKSWHDSVKYITCLDIKLLEEDTIDIWDQGGKESFERLVDFIANNLNLAGLELSLDSGETWEEYCQALHTSEEDIRYVSFIYQEMVEILSAKLVGRKPKSFFIYWAAFFDMEAEGERAIMGQDYDSEKIGKIPHTRRSPYYPHGAPSKNLEFPNGFSIEHGLSGH